MDSTSLVLSSFCAASLPLLWLTHRHFWQRFAKPKARGSLVLVALLSLGLGGTPTVMMWHALAVGEVPCRYCSDGFLALTDAPIAYWLTVAFLYIGAVLFLSGLAFAVHSFVRWPRPRR